MRIMKKNIFLIFVLFVISDFGLAKGMLLNDLNTDHQITDGGLLNDSPYTIGITPESNAFIGDNCSQESKEKLNSHLIQNKNQGVECYITHFPKSDIKTNMQSNEEGDMSFSFSWDLN